MMRYKMEILTIIVILLALIGILLEWRYRFTVMNDQLDKRESSLNDREAKFAQEERQEYQRLALAEEQAEKQELQNFATLQNDIRGLPQGLLGAIILVESRWMADAVRHEPNGMVSRGCAQFIDRFKLDYSNGVEFDSYDCKQSITVLAEWLEKQLESGKDLRSVLEFYNGGHTINDRNRRYAAKILDSIG